MSVKEAALETIAQLPDDADWEIVLRRLAFVSGVQQGLDELDQGKSIPVEEVERELQTWLTK